MQTRREFLIQTALAGVTASASAAARDSDAVTRMKTYKLPQADISVSRLAYGTAMLGIDQRDPEFVQSAVRAMHTAYDCGITLFDLADVYGRGRSELACARFLKDSPGVRDKILIQSKCGIRLPRNWVPGDDLGDEVAVTDLSRAHIVSAAHSSLKRLGTTHLDILLLHVPDHLVQPEEVAQAFTELHASGAVHHFGVSNFNVMQIELLRRYVQQPLVTNQVRLSLARCSAIHDRTSYGGLVDYCRVHDIQVQAYSPLKGDNASGKPILLNPPADAAAEVKQTAQLLANIANKHESTPAAIMIAWLLRHPAGIVPILGSTTPKHIIESCRADKIDLSSEEWQKLLWSALAIQKTNA